MFSQQLLRRCNRYGYADPYVGRPASDELDEDMAFDGIVPIECMSFRGKHPTLGECVFTIQKYTRKKDRKGRHSYSTYIFREEDGFIWDERGPFAEREVISDMDHLMDRFMESKDSYATGLKISNPVSEIKHIC